MFGPESGVGGPHVCRSSGSGVTFCASGKFSVPPLLCYLNCA